MPNLPLAVDADGAATAHARLSGTVGRLPLLERVGRVSLRSLLWSLIGCYLAADIVWAIRVGLSVSGWEKAAAATAALLALSVIYRCRKRAVADMASMAALWIALSATGCVLTYLGATCALPLQDAVLTNFDQALGFNWLAWRDATAARPGLNLTLSWAYDSLMPQILLGSLILPALGMTERSVELIFLAAFTLVPTTVISALWPALGPFAVFGGERAEYLPHVLTLRTPGPWHFDLPTMQGILTMPSYHAVLALIFIYVFRRTGLLGWMVTAVNGIMLLSIAPIGGHYFSDIVVGVVIALLCIALVRGGAAVLQSNAQWQAV